MRRHVALIVSQRPAQTLAIDQQLIQLPGQGLAHIFAHISLVGLATKDAFVQFLLELPGQWRPVGTHTFKPLVDHLFVPVTALHQAGIALLAAFLGTADGRHQEALVVGLVLQFQGTVQVVAVA
ncbi:hypothetical protein D3C84_926250 [compost metagenome]